MSENQKKIYIALNAILNEIKPVEKNKEADMKNAGKYMFRGIDDLYNELHSAFAKHKVFILPEILSEKSEVIEKKKVWSGNETISYSKYVTLKMKYSFIAEDGSSVESVGIGEAIDSSDKATNKAQSSALKYILMQMFLIPTKDEKDVETQNNKIEINPKTYQKPQNPAPQPPQTQEPIAGLLVVALGKEKGEDLKKLGFENIKITKEQATACGFKWTGYDEKYKAKYVWKAPNLETLNALINPETLKAFEGYWISKLATIDLDKVQEIQVDEELPNAINNF